MSLLDTLTGMDGQGTAHIPVTVQANKPAETSELRIIPYNATYDSQAADFLYWMWGKMKQDDLVDYYFPGQKETGFATFVRMMSGEANVALVLRNDPSKQWDETVAGFITWTVTVLGASPVAIAGFIFFRKFWDHRLTDEAAAKAFKFWFTETEAKLVLGVCPALHRTAMIYNKRVGLRETGRLPMAHLYKGQPCDAVLFVMTREDWEKGGH